MSSFFLLRITDFIKLMLGKQAYIQIYVNKCCMSRSVLRGQFPYYYIYLGRREASVCSTDV